MLTDEDIQKLLTVLETRFATKQDLEKVATKQDLKEALDDNVQRYLKVFVTKTEFKEEVDKLATKSDINNLMTAIDVYAKKADTYFQEMVMLNQKVNMLEKWIHQLADQSGIKLQY